MNREQLVKLAEAKGCNKFSASFFENSKTCQESWYLELHLLKKWLLDNHNISVSVETGWMDNKFCFEINLWIDFGDNLLPEIYKTEIEALEFGIEQGLIMIDND